jgi:mannosyltransferase OCH1-like enzyme
VSAAQAPSTGSAAGAIPRVVHRVWLGSEAMPEEYQAYGESWRRHHPEWEMRLWTDADAADLGCAEAIERARSYVEGSDLMRYEVLRRHGGVYVDTDFEALRPIDPLLDGITAFTAHARVGRTKIGTGAMGCVAGHPAFSRAAELAHERVGAVRLGETGPWLMTEIVHEFPDVTVFPAELFYPYHWSELHLRHSEFPDAYAVHHWSLRFQEKLYERYVKLQDRHAKARATIKELERRLGKMTAKAEEERRRRKEQDARLRELERSAWGRVGSRARRSSAGR